MKGTFYDNSGSVKDEFTIKKSGTTSSNATNVTSFSIGNANVTMANATEETFQVPNENSSTVNLNISNIIKSRPLPSYDNQSSMLNLTNSSTFVSNDSENNSTNGVIDHINREGVGESHYFHNRNSSLQVDSEVITDTSRNKTTKIVSNLAKVALDEAEQALNDNKIITTNRNLSEATDVSKYSDLSDTIDTYDEPGVRIKHQLAQEAETQIDRAWKGLDDKLGNIVTKMEVADSQKSDSGPGTSDASNIRSPDIGPTNSNSKNDSLATENQLHTPTIQAGKSQDSHSAVRKIDLKANAGQNQEVVEEATVTLDGTNSKIGDDSGRLSYSWKQIAGPKVMIVDANTAIASFETPKVSSAGDKLTLKFLLSITDDSDGAGRNNDKDSVTVIVKQAPSQSHKDDLASSANNDNDRASSQPEVKPHSDDGQVVDNNDGSKNNANGKSEELKYQESAPESDSTTSIDSTQIDTSNSNTSSN